MPQRRQPERRAAAQQDYLRRQQKACILLWMAGGPSQFETLDPKPGAETQGPTGAIATATPGIRIAEHWTRLARVTNDLCIIRSMTSREGNHGRATYLLHTSYAPSGGVVHPGMGSLVARELGRADAELPNFVSVSGQSRQVAKLHANDVFGEMGMLTGEPRTATVTALTDTVCYRLDKQAFNDTLHRRPEIAVC